MHLEKMLLSLQSISRENNIPFTPTIFFDEPQAFHYSFKLENNSKVNENIGREIYSSGISFFSEYEALGKCLGEAIERYSLDFHGKGKLREIEACDWNENKIRLKKILGRRIHYVQGTDISNKCPCLLPASLIYREFYSESDLLDVKVSRSISGTAGSFILEQALLNGIYELIERDSFMNIYLCSFGAPRIDVESLHGKRIKKIVNKFQKFELETYIFDITTDIKVPSFASFIVDKSGIGPVLTMGLRAGYDCERAIIDSLSEAFKNRLAIRHLKIMDNSSNDYLDVYTKKRIAAWNSISSLKKLNFLLKQKPTQRIYKKDKLNVKEELEYISTSLKEHGLNIYYADITAKFSKGIGYHVVRTVIPGLQQFFQDEKEKKIINKERLFQVAKFFDIKAKINPIPHPFL